MALTLKGSRSVSILILAAATASAWAQDKGWYLGASVGQSIIDASSAAIDEAIVGRGFTAAATQADDTAPGWKLYAGYRALRYFAVEGTYVDLGKTSFDTQTLGPPSQLHGNVRADALSLDGMGLLPIGERFMVFARAGLFRWDSDAKLPAVVNGQATLVPEDGDGANLKLGVGGNLHLSRHFSLRFDYERYRGVGQEDETGTGDVDFYSAGFQLRF
jgi:OOP family OmpA-OmpF porin